MRKTRMSPIPLSFSSVGLATGCWDFCRVECTSLALRTRESIFSAPMLMAATSFRDSLLAGRGRFLQGCWARGSPCSVACSSRRRQAALKPATIQRARLLLVDVFARPFHGAVLSGILGSREFIAGARGGVQDRKEQSREPDVKNNKAPFLCARMLLGPLLSLVALLGHPTLVFPQHRSAK